MSDSGDILQILADGPLGQLATFLVEEEPWREEAACRDMDVSLFFPERGASTKEAKRTCERCPVAVECGEYANKTGTQYGIWAARLRNPGKLKIERDAEQKTMDSATAAG